MSIQKRISGIYMIEAVSGSRIGWKYIGQTRNRNRRQSDHYMNLKYNKHDNPKLQNYYNKYGKNSLQWLFLIECSENDLNFWEKFFITSFDSRKDGFNCNNGGQDLVNDGNKKWGKLKNVNTGEIVEFDSIIDFCNKYSLEYQAICALLRKERNMSQGWVREDYKLVEFEILDKNNNLYKIKKSEIKNFCRNRNLTYTPFWNVLTGKQNYFNGWHRKNSKIIKQCTHFEKEYDLISPDGELIHIKNLSEFSRNNNLSDRALNRVANKKQNVYKGWRKYENNIELKPFKKPTYKFVNLHGKIFETDNQKQFAQEHNLIHSNINCVWTGKLKKHRGWTKYKE